MSEKNTRLAKEIERVEDVLEELREQAEKGIPLIVEGKKDVKALNNLEISGRLIALKSKRRSVFNQLEYDIPDEEVIVFTDFDRRGSDLARSVQEHLQQRGRKANIIFWRKMKKLVGRNVKDVEGLPSYLATLREQSNKTLPNLSA